MHILKLTELYLRLVNSVVCKFYFHKNYDFLFPQKSFRQIAELKDFYRNTGITTMLTFCSCVTNHHKISGFEQHTFIILPLLWVRSLVRLGSLLRDFSGYKQNAG